MTRFREPFAIVSVEAVDRAAAFYCSTVGFERPYSVEDGGSPAFAFLQLEPDAPQARRSRERQAQRQQHQAGARFHRSLEVGERAGIHRLQQSD